MLAGQNLTSALEKTFQKHKDITPQQRAVAQDLSYGTLRFYGRANALLEQLLQKPLQDRRIHDLLLIALYQLNYDKAAQHTIVDQAVKAASLVKKPWVKGLVNAVLRNFIRHKNDLEQTLTNHEIALFRIRNGG